MYIARLWRVSVKSASRLSRIENQKKILFGQPRFETRLSKTHFTFSTWTLIVAGNLPGFAVTFVFRLLLLQASCRM